MQTHWFKDRIADKKLSQRALAHLLGIDPAAVSYLLKGKRRMTPQEASTLGEILGYPTLEIMRRAGVAVSDDLKTARIVATIDLDGRVTELEPDQQITVDAPPDCPTNSQVIQVRAPGSTRDGWMFYATPAIDDPRVHAGKLCYVKQFERNLLAVVSKGYASGFNLSTDSGELIFTNQSIESAQPILWIKPA